MASPRSNVITKKERKAENFGEKGVSEFDNVKRKETAFFKWRETIGNVRRATRN